MRIWNSQDEITFYHVWVFTTLIWSVKIKLPESLYEFIP